jgi:hypothetical protein
MPFYEVTANRKIPIRISMRITPSKVSSTQCRVISNSVDEEREHSEVVGGRGLNPNESTIILIL